MNATQYKEYFSREFQGMNDAIEKVFTPIFGEFTEKTNPKGIDYADDAHFGNGGANIDHIYDYGTYYTDSTKVSVFEVILADNCHISIARKNIQNTVCRITETYSGAFIVFHYSDGSKNTEAQTWRLSWLKRLDRKDSPAKRYTYLCGPSYSCRTIAQRFDELQKTSNKNLDSITKAFDVEALSDEFFKEYKVMYDDIVQWITGQRIIKKDGKWKLDGRFGTGHGKKVLDEFKEKISNDEGIVTKAVRDYVKKLMGRLVFIQFLQKRGWLKINGQPTTNFLLDLFNGIDENLQNDFIEKPLEQVVYLLLNNENRKPEDEKIGNLELNVPFLNGGLFERDQYDKLEIKLPKEFFHNETYKEDKRVLSETRLRDNENFFTQCGILDFFNQYNFTIDENDPNDAEVGVDPEMLGKIFENLLEDNKDKGAFYTPKEIVQYMCNESLIAYLQTIVPNHDDKIRQFVLDAEQKNVPEKGKILNAIKEVKICDPAIGSGAFPMGLLNLLVALREKLDSSTQRVELKKSIIQNNIYGVDIEKGAIDIARLRFWLSIMVDETTPTPLPNFDYKFMQGNSLLECYNGVELNLMKSSDSSLDFAEAERNNLQKLLRKYFDCTDHTDKISLQKDIENNIKDILKLQGYTIDLSGINLSGNDKFFLWHTWFADVFEKSGFDIVIGNPPYVSYYSRQAINIEASLLEFYKKSSRFISNKKAKGRNHSVQFFLGKGMDLMNKNGLCSYIIDISFFEKPFSDIRKYILDNYHVKEIVSDLVAFDNVASGQIILSIDNNKSDKSIWKTDINGSPIVVSNTLWKTDSNNQFFLPSNDPLLNKIENGTKPLEPDLGIVRTGVNIGGVKSFFLTNDPSYYPFISGSTNVQRYNICYPTGLQVRKGETFFKFDKKIEKYIWDNKIGTPSIGEDNDRFTRPKIIIRQSDIRITAAIDIDKAFHCGYSLFTFNAKDDDIIFLKYVLGVLNSTLMTYYAKEKKWLKIIAGKQPQIRVDDMKKMPICININRRNEKKIVALVDQILAAKKSNPQADTTALEHKIDRLVYLLYGLTWDEVQIVENSSVHAALSINGATYSKWLERYQKDGTLPSEEEMDKAVK